MYICVCYRLEKVPEPSDALSTFGFLMGFWVGITYYIAHKRTCIGSSSSVAMPLLRQSVLHLCKTPLSQNSMPSSCMSAQTLILPEPHAQ